MAEEKYDAVEYIAPKDSFKYLDGSLIKYLDGSLIMDGVTAESHGITGTKGSHVTVKIEIVGYRFNTDDLCEFIVPKRMVWFLLECIHIIKLASRKNAGYATGVDWFDNFSGGGLKGLYNRLNDKMKRLKTHIRNLADPGPDGQNVDADTFIDTCQDIASYGILMKGARDAGVSVDGLDWI